MMPSFMGGNAFCLKACDPSKPNAAQYCEHRFDRIGCAFNAPNNAQNGTFETCDAENADFPGVYTTNGATVTYTQPPEELGPIATMPYTARVPSSSNCQTIASAALFTGLPTLAPSTTAAPTQTGLTTSVTTGAASHATTSGKPTTTGTSNGSTLAASGLAAMLGVAFSVLFLS